MFRLSDLYSKIIKKTLPTDCGISCEVLDTEMAKLNNLLSESVSCFSYTLVLAGTIVIDYDDKATPLGCNDIFISTPGMRVYTKEVSDDFSALCLLCDEVVIYEIPYARNVILASYYPSLVNSGNKFSLSHCESRWLENRMNEIILYIKNRHIFKNQCLYSLYSLFILDLLNVQGNIEENSEFNNRAIDMFLRFQKLLTHNFIDHHDIAFYANSLSVTTIYLSRIVKRISGMTVKNHVDRLLVMEASYLLITTDEPIASIAERLSFANPASFCKFFIRHKGISPREYRTRTDANLSVSIALQ